MKGFILVPQDTGHTGTIKCQSRLHSQVLTLQHSTSQPGWAALISSALRFVRSPPFSLLPCLEGAEHSSAFSLLGTMLQTTGERMKWFLPFPSPGSAIPHPLPGLALEVVFAFAFSQVMGEGCGGGPGGPKPFADFAA